MKKRITFDFETRSRCELKKAGAYKYSRDPSTQPTCLAFRDSTNSSKEPILFRFHAINQKFSQMADGFQGYWTRVIDEGYEFSSHNAFFERCIYTNILVRRYGWPLIPARQYRCTAAKAAACALPRALGNAGEAMRLPVQKDFRGYSAMMATCKPTKAWNAWKKKVDRGAEVGPEPPVFLEPDVGKDVFETLYTYCKIDVQAEEALDNALPDLSPDEQEIWHLNQALNWRGLRIDIPTVKKVVAIMADEGKRKLTELDTLTMGLVTSAGSRDSIFEFLALEGVKIDNLRAKTVDDKLNGFELSGDMRRLLELRKALSLTSTKKYQSFLNRANRDDRIRDILMYHGASTGRDTGTGVQPHNFPRGLIKVEKAKPYAAVENVVECDAEMLRILYGDSLGLLFSAILRNMIIPSDGYELFVADFAKIEVAVLWWLAGNEPGLKILRAGMDPYLYMASANTGRPYVSFTDDSPERQLGKAQVLGCGFGMGADKFKITAANSPDRIMLTDEQAKAAVMNYRTANPAVPLLWKAYEGAAIAALDCADDRGTAAGRCHFQVYGKFLWVTLPSGRKLAYREPQLAWRETDYGPRKTLEFFAVNSKTKKWALERTWGGTLTENIVQAAARDLIMRALVNLEAAGYRALLTVHDEAINEAVKGTKTLEEFTRIMCDVPPWAKGLPLTAKGWVGPRYRK